MNAYENLLIRERPDAAGHRDALRSLTVDYESSWPGHDPFEPQNGRCI
jgi:hypothetical protein